MVYKVFESVSNMPSDQGRQSPHKGNALVCGCMRSRDMNATLADPKSVMQDGLVGVW